MKFACLLRNLFPLLFAYGVTEDEKIKMFAT